MNKRSVCGQRLLCLFLILFMILAGMRTEVIQADSFSSSLVCQTAAIQQVRGAKDIVLYRSTNLLEMAEKCSITEPVRRTAQNMRIGQWFLTAIILAALLGQQLPADRSVLPRGVCENQYRRRTLDYIHHMDGKKA